MINDHTDAEIARREHDYEMGARTQDEIAFDRFECQVVAGLFRLNITTLYKRLDGDQDEDGFSLDFASDAFDAGKTPEDYIAEVIIARHALGFSPDFPDGREAAAYGLKHIAEREAAMRDAIMSLGT